MRREGTGTGGCRRGEKSPKMAPSKIERFVSKQEKELYHAEKRKETIPRTGGEKRGEVRSGRKMGIRIFKTMWEKHQPKTYSGG